MSTQRNAFWLSTESGPLFTWFHAPAPDSTGESLGIVICNPVGHEYTHSHRSFRHLADTLAQSGYPTLRFDYHGTGNSAGSMLAPQRIDVWLDNIQAQIDWLKRHTKASTIALIGLRFGATLAALSTTKQAIDYLVLWNPCIKGKRYARELTSLAKMAASPKPYHEDFIETAGFLLSTETLEKLKSTDLMSEPLTVNGRVLIVNRDDGYTDDSYANHLEQQNIPVDILEAPGYQDMLAEPQDTKVPGAAITSVVEWFNRQQSTSERPGDDSATHLALVDNASRAEMPHGQGDVRESLIIVEQRQQLFGVLTEPLQKPAACAKPLIVLSNSGSVHHVGPNRLYVDLSRSLAQAGFDCFRYDLGNLGDSYCETAAQENHPYPTQAIDNLASVLNYLQEKLGYQKFILAGLCSGSHLSFHAGLALQNYPIIESVLINPLTFYWKDGMSLDIPSAHQVNKDANHYENAIKDLGNWVRLVKGQVDIAYIIKFTLKLAIQRCREAVKNTLERIAILPPSQLGQDLLRFKKAGKRISFIFSRSDPGYKILVSEAKLITKKMAAKHDLSLYFIDDADHTFSKYEKRFQLTDILIRHLRSHSFLTIPPAEQQF